MKPIKRNLSPESFTTPVLFEVGNKVITMSPIMASVFKPVPVRSVDWFRKREMYYSMN